MSKMVWHKSFLCAAAMLAASVAGAGTYEVTGDVSNLDLTTGGYDADRLIGPAPGGNPCTLSGTFTHATATLENPFHLIGNPANTASSSNIGQLNLNVAGIDATTPLSFSGYGIFCLDQPYQTDASWSDSYLQTDGSATGYFSDLRLAFQDITLDRDNPSNLYRLMYGPNQTKRKKDGNGSVDAQCWNLYVGYGDAGSASLTLRNAYLSVYDNFRLGVSASTDSSVAAVRGSLVLDNSVLELCKNRQDFKSGTNCPDSNNHVASTNVVVLGPESRMIARRIIQERAPSLLFTFAGGTLETSWSRSGHDHSLFTSQGKGRIVVTNAPGCDFRFDVSSAYYYPLANDASRVSIAGDGNFVKLGSGDLRVNVPVRTTGTTRIEEGVLSVSENDALPTVTSISSNAVLDICEVRQVVQAPWGGGLVRSSSEVPGTLALVCNENMTLENVSPNVNIEKLGNGTLTANGTFGDEISVRQGKLVLAPPPTPTRYWRFKVDGIRGNANMMQFSEIRLLSCGADVTSAATVTYDTDPAHNPTKSNNCIPFNAGQEPEKAYDNNFNTKWLDYRARYNEPQEVRDAVWLKFDFGEDGALVTGYEWYTAEDANDRDPVSWRFQRSDDGEGWEDIDVQANYSVTTTRKTLAYRYENTGLAGEVNPLKSIAVAENATLEIDGIDVVASSIVAPEGAIRLVNGGTLTLEVDVDDGDARSYGFGDIWLPGGTGVRKTGDGEATLTGLSGLSGEIAVDGGELRIAPASALANAKYFRFTVKDTYGHGIFQCSELYLYDSSYNRVNSGLFVTNLADLVAGSAAFDTQYLNVANYSFGNSTQGLDKLFDDDFDTKLCVTGPRPNDPATTSNWCIVVMRLPDNAAQVAYYSFRTGGDATPSRNPDDWTLEASVDGDTWTLIDTRTDAGATPTATKTESEKFPVTWPPASSGSSGESAFAAGSRVLVADRARLVLDDDGATEIHGLEIDAVDGAGTIENFKAANTGAIYLTNVESVSELARAGDLITFENTSERPSFAGWTVYVNGRQTSLRVAATATGMRLVKPGSELILR